MEVKRIGLIIFVLFYIFPDIVPANVIFISTENTTGDSLVKFPCSVFDLDLGYKNIVADTPCTTEPVRAWVNVTADFGPWVEFEGCAKVMIINSTVIRCNFTKAPNLSDCERKCYNTAKSKQMFFSFNNDSCFCYFENDIERINCLDMLTCGYDLFCHQDYPNYGNIIPFYSFNTSFIMTTQTTRQCGAVEIKNNTYSYKARTCTADVTVLCYELHSRNLTAYPGTQLTWLEAIEFCRRQDSQMVTTENLKESSLLGIPDSIYWLSVYRELVKAEHGNTSKTSLCVASDIVHSGKMKPIVISCNSVLPVACYVNSSMTNLTKCDEITTLGNVTSTGSLSTTPVKDKNDLQLVQFTTGGICVVAVILGLAIYVKCKLRGRTGGKTSIAEVSNSSKAPMSTSRAYSEVQKQSTTVTVLQKENDVYDHTETFKDGKDTTNSAENNYDTMAGVRQETEGIYDKTGDTINLSQLHYVDETDDENAYDHV